MTERELERRAKHKLAVLQHVEEVSGSVAATCRYYGISRTCYYKWFKRYEEEGFEGLKDRSSAPHHSPTATDAEVVEKILWLRQQYHFGPRKISMYLQRYHEITISPSGVWRILNKAGVNRLPASQRYKRHETRWKRYEKQRPGHQLQVDVKFIEPLGQKGRRSATTSTPRSMTAPDCGSCGPTPQRPADRDPVHRPRAVQAAVRGRAGPDRQRPGVRLSLPLAPARQGHRPHPDPTPDTTRAGSCGASETAGLWRSSSLTCRGPASSSMADSATSNRTSRSVSGTGLMPGM